jgi:hypothetical protein
MVSRLDGTIEALAILILEYVAVAQIEKVSGHFLLPSGYGSGIASSSLNAASNAALRAHTRSSVTPRGV